MPSTSNKRIAYFDMLNIAACICVIFLHCNSMVHGFAPGRNWILALGIECVFYWAVPVFFMLTGATLMRYRERYDTKSFFERRLLRILVPFLAWNVIWYFWLGLTVAPHSFGLRDFLSRLFNNEIEQIYWFFYPLFSCYLSLPALSWLSEKQTTLVYLVIGSFILQAVMPTACSMLGISWNGGLNVGAISGYLFFLVLGYLLSVLNLNSKKRMLIYMLGIFGLLFRFIYTLISSEMSGTLDRTLFNYTGFPSVLYASAVFVWFRYHDWSRVLAAFQKLNLKPSQLAACSFGVYLIHKPLLDYVVIGMLGIDKTSIAFRTIGALLFYLVCVLLVSAMRRVPLLNRIVP